MVALKGTSSIHTGGEPEGLGAWLLMYQAGEAWSDEVVRVAVLREQAAYFQTLRLSGMLRFGGLLDDGASALAILHGVKQAKAVELLAGDEAPPSEPAPDQRVNRF